MLAILFLYIIITLASSLAGFLFYYYIIRDNNYERAGKYRPVIFYLVTGLIVFTVLTQLFILAWPATITFRIGLLLLPALFTIISARKIIPFITHITHEVKNINPATKFIFAATCCMILVVNAGPTLMDDTDSYHIQMVKWIQEYGTVPGLANLHRRFGFNSSWFSSIALFSVEWKGYNFFTTLNGLLSVWFAGYLLSVAGKKNHTDGTQPFFPVRIVYFILFAVAMIAWPILRGNPASANYDFITLLVIFVLFSELILSPPGNGIFKYRFEWIIWPVFLITVRIINFPLVLLSIFTLVVIIRQKSWSQLVLYSFLCFVLIIPFLIRNVIITGYLFYPALYFDWFNVDWKASKEKTAVLLNYIKYYNRVSTGFMDINQTASLGFPGWISAWFKYMATYNKMLLISGLAGMLMSPFFLRKNRLFNYTAIRIFFAVILAQTIVWFITAPDPRFIYGCLATGILLFAITLKKILVYADSKKAYQLLFLATGFVITSFTLHKVITQPQYTNWIFPAKLPTPPVKNLTIDHIEIHIPENILNNWNPRCYATDLPCLYEADPRLQARGETVADGFKLKD